MQVRDIMTTAVATVTRDTPVADVVNLLLQRHISAVPVVDDDGNVLGMVSEGDLLRRHETGTERHRSWWLGMLSSSEELAADYVKSHGQHAGEVMTHPAITTGEDTPLAEIADILESHRIKRLPVVRDGKLVGLVARADLLRALAAEAIRLGAGEPPTDDRSIREQMLKALEDERWVSSAYLNVVVSDGVIHLWGMVGSDEEREALKVAAESIPGVKGVETHLSKLPGLAWQS